MGSAPFGPRISLPHTLFETRTYYPSGNLKSLQHFNGVTTTYTYDSLNRLLSRATPGETTVSFTYWPGGKRHSMTDASGTTTYTYDSMDRLTQKATPEGTLTYTYDGDGHLASMQSSNANGVDVSYTYDSLNRLSTVVDARLSGNQTATYTYDDASNVATVKYPNGVQTAMNYDSLNRISTMASTSPSAEISGYSYARDHAGKVSNVTELDTRSVTWSYDGINRLYQEQIANDQHGKGGLLTYTLDPVGNRTADTSTVSGLSPLSGTFNQDDELTSESYDSNGNVTATSGKTFAYDSENHLISMGSTAALVYDGDGNRVQKNVSGAITSYLVDDLNPTGYPQVVDELTNGVVSRTYTYGLERISQEQIVSNAWTPSFYVYDGGGNVRQLTNTSGTVTDTYEYDGFGNEISSTGSTLNSYLYRGEAYDSDLGLYYLRARWMNPVTGRFMSRDPEDGKFVNPKSLHKYLYAAGDPVNASDPTGRAALEEETFEDLKRLYVVATFGVELDKCFIAALQEEANFLQQAYQGQLTTPDPAYEIVKSVAECSVEKNPLKEALGLPPVSIEDIENGLVEAIIKRILTGEY